MLGELFSKATNAITTPARKAIDSGSEALKLVRALPAELEHLATEFRLAQQETEQKFQQMMQQVDASFDRDIADMTSSERESAAYVELVKAEQFLSQAMFSLLRVMRLAIAESGRVIEHRDAQKSRWKRLR